MEIVWCLAILCWAIEEVPKCAEMEDMCRNHREKCVSFRENRRCLIAVTSASPKTVVKAINLGLYY